MKAKFLKTFAVGLATLFLSSCGPSLSYLIGEKQGLYPTAADYPNTKWVCRELDFSFCMLDYEENSLIGEYEFNEESYRVVGSFFYGELNFEIYCSTIVTSSEHMDKNGTSFVECEQVSAGFIYTDYQLKEGSLVCSVRNYDIVIRESIPKTLTFDKVGSIAQQPSARWYAQELDMYFDTFSDIEGYVRGVTVYDGKKCFVHAWEVGNDNLYNVFIENGIFNNFKSKTTSPFINMYLEIQDGQITARISEEALTNPLDFPYWNYTGASIRFLPYSPN